MRSVPRLREEIDPDEVFPPVPLAFALPPLARLTGTEAVIIDDGLVIHGDMTVALPTPPRLKLSPSRLVFLESATSACSVGLPTFDDQTVYLRNSGGSSLFLCSVATTGGFTIVETSDPAVTVAADGHSLRFADNGLDRSESLAVTLHYAGLRGERVDSSLAIVCNDPADMLRDVALTVPPSRPLAWNTDPIDVLEINVANSRPDEDFRMVADCREIVVRRPPESLQRPAGEVRGPQHRAGGRRALRDQHLVRAVRGHRAALAAHRAGRVAHHRHPVLPHRRRLDRRDGARRVRPGRSAADRPDPGARRPRSAEIPLGPRRDR